LDAWAWPTHHYGRWGYASNAWFWIPGRTWGAAWVSWSFADDYVSWCPLGYDSRPVFALSIGSQRVGLLDRAAARLRHPRVVCWPLRPRLFGRARTVIGPQSS